jgi:hypothetical protein
MLMGLTAHYAEKDAVYKFLKNRADLGTSTTRLEDDKEDNKGQY